MQPSAAAWPRLDRRTLLAAALLTVAVAVLVSPPVAAGTTGSELQDLYDKLTGWMTGYLGRVIAVVFILVGVIAGAARQSIMGFVLGIAAGVGLFLAPDVIDSTVSATLPVVAAPQPGNLPAPP